MKNPARDAILSRTRVALGKSSNDVERRTVVEARIKGGERGTLPTRTQGDAVRLKAQFIEMLQDAAATTAVIDSVKDLPKAVADYLKSQNLPAHIRTGTDPLLGGVNWSDVPTLEVANGAAEDADQTGLAVAFAGASENRNPDARIGRRQSRDPEFPAGNPHRRLAGVQDSRGV